MKRDVLADAIDILRDDGVVNEFALLFDLRGHAATEPHFFVKRVEIDLPLVDVALADQTRVFIFTELAFVRSRRRLLNRRLVIGLLGIFRVFLVVGKQRRRHADQRRQQQDGDALQEIYFHWKDSYRKEVHHAWHGPAY